MWRFREMIRGFRYILFFVISLSLHSCKITYKVRNLKNELESILHFPCGKVGFELIGKGNSKFIFRQRFEVKEKITVVPDAIDVLYNNKKVEIQWNVNKRKENMQGVDINDNEILELNFELENGVFDGDTIAIFGPRYVQCDEKSISIDTIYYTFTNRLRIYGVNVL